MEGNLKGHSIGAFKYLSETASETRIQVVSSVVRANRASSGKSRKLGFGKSVLKSSEIVRHVSPFDKQKIATQDVFSTLLPPNRSYVGAASVSDGEKHVLVVLRRVLHAFKLVQVASDNQNDAFAVVSG